MAAEAEEGGAIAARLERVIGKLQRRLEKSQRETAAVLADLSRCTREAEDAKLLQREIDHRAKNSLMLAASMLQLHASRSQNETVKEQLEGATRRLHTLATVHAALHQGAEGDEAPVGWWLDRICGGLPAAPQIALQVDAPEVCWPSGIVVPLGLLAGEAVANAIKHAFPNGRAGRVQVQLHRVGAGRWSLEIKDDGAGRVDNIREGLGLKLLRTFARQLHADLTLDPGFDDRGICVRATFDAPDKDDDLLL